MSKNIFVSSLEGHIGDVIEESFLVKRVTSNVTKDGNPWISCVLSDITGVVHAKIWAENMQNVAYETYVNKIIKVCAVVDMYDGDINLSVKNITIAEEYDTDDFVESISNEQKEFCISILYDYIGMVKADDLRLLLNKTFAKTLKYFTKLPAGKSFHHAFNGALIVHTLEVCRIAVCMAETDMMFTKPYTTPVDMDLVIAGALFHDIGKLVEYSSFPDCERSLRGVLNGHLVEGVKCLISMNQQLGDKKVEQGMIDKLEHIILASHGDKGVTKPMIKEAVIVKNADMQSAEIDAFDTCFKNHDERHPGNRDSRIWNKFSDCYAIREV